MLVSVCEYVFYKRGTSIFSQSENVVGYEESLASSVMQFSLMYSIHESSLIPGLSAIDSQSADSAVETRAK